MVEDATKREPLNWYKSFGFEDDNFAFQMAWALGQVYDRQGDISEIMVTCHNIVDGDIISWYNEFYKTAVRVEEIGINCEKKGHRISAGEAYHRASNYFRMSEFYLHKDPADLRALGAAKKAVDCFQKAMKLLKVPVEYVRIPYENTTLPGYLYKSPISKKEAPLLIVQSGFDGTAEELYGIGNAAIKRGYNCLVFEGPGQGQTIRDQGLPFRYDWENVISPVIDYALDVSGSDPEKIAVLGISFGGWLISRAACFEHRPKVYIANPGGYSFADNTVKFFPQELMKIVSTDPDEFNRQINTMREMSVVLDWGISDGVWKFDCTSPADFIMKIQDYTLTEELVDKITSYMIVVDSEGEDMMEEGEPQRLFKAIRGPKDFMLFTINETAEAHCQIAALSILYQRTFDRLDELMNN